MTEQTAKTVSLAPLTAQGFAPYGTVIEPVGDSVPINDGTTQKFSDVAQVELDSGARASMHIYRPQPTKLPYAMYVLERHPLASQAFVPLGGYRFAVVVAGNTDEPNRENLRAFVSEGGQGVQFASGVWHCPFLALDRGDFLIIDRFCATEEEVRSNLDLIDIADWCCSLAP